MRRLYREAIPYAGGSAKSAPAFPRQYFSLGRLLPLSMFGARNPLVGTREAGINTANVGMFAFLRQRQDKPHVTKNEEAECVNGGGAPSVDGITPTDAFNRWSRDVRCCNAEEFLQGAKQAYRSLGVLLETLSEAASLKVAAGKPVMRDVALMRLRALLRNYTLSEEVLDNIVASSAKSDTRDDHAVCVAVSKALRDVLPISQDLAEHLYVMWDRQRTFDSNVLDIAAPNDYIFGAEMILFNPFLVNTPEDLREPHTLAEGKGTEETPMAVIRIRNNRASSRFTSCPRETNITVGMEADQKLTNTRVAVRFPEDLSSRILKPFPSLLPIVFVTLDVVTPPQRYCEAFDWFYQRIYGHANEYERVEVARLYATPGLVLGAFRQCLFLVDFVKRMLVGRPLRLYCTNMVVRLHGKSLDISVCPPAVRKVLCFHLGRDEHWVLFDIFTSRHILTPVPSAAASR